MEIDWIIAGFKTGGVALTGLVVNHYRKPFYNWAKEFVKLVKEVVKLKARVDELELDMSVMKSKQMADLHTDKTPTFIVNTKGELIYVNPAWVVLFEYRDPESAYGMRFMDIIHPDDYRRIKAIHKELIEHPSGFNDEIKYRTKETKKTIRTLCVSELVHDKNNKIIETIGRLYVLDP